MFHVPTFVLPAPSAVIRSLIANRAQLASAAESTALEILLGFVLAAITGIAVALVIVRFERFGRALYPLIVLFQNVPKVALAPIFILWFGFDLAPKIVLIVVIAFFPVAIDMLAGLQSVEPSFVALMQSVGASRTKILLRVRIPHSLPHLMAGLKVAITFSVIGAIVGEFAGANRGLGYVIEFASTQLDTPLIFAALVVVSVLGLAFYYVVELAERLLVPWAPKFDALHRAELTGQKERHHENRHSRRIRGHVAGDVPRRPRTRSACSLTGSCAATTRCSSSPRKRDISPSRASTSPRSAAVPARPMPCGSSATATPISASAICRRWPWRARRTCRSWRSRRSTSTARSPCWRWPTSTSSKSRKISRGSMSACSRRARPTSS